MPAGTLPAGPATAHAKGWPPRIHYAVRFNVPANAPYDFELPAYWAGSSAPLPVVIDSDSGQSWSTSVAFNEDAREESAPRFLGSGSANLLPVRLASTLRSWDAIRLNPGDSRAFPTGVFSSVALTVFAIGSVALWLALRNRRWWYPLVCFPSSAVLTSLAIYAAAHLLGEQRSQPQRTLFTSPEGAGLAYHALFIESPTLKEFELRIPWKPQLQVLQPLAAPKLGGPFKPSNGLHILEDRTTAVLSVSGFLSEHAEEAGPLWRPTALRWNEPIQVSAPRLFGTSRQAELINATNRSIRRAVAVTDSLRLEFDALAPGERKAAKTAGIMFGSGAHLNALDHIVFGITGDHAMDSGTYVLAVEYADGSSGIDTKPPVNANHQEIHVVVGAL